MTSFFIYRSCDVTDTGARRAVQRHADVLNRGIALVQAESGLPNDDSAGSDNPTLPLVSAAWDVATGSGILPAGTYNYNVVPINSCTGRTGQAQAVPPLTISSLGQVANLRMKLSAIPADCNGMMVQRNGKVVGAIFPTSQAIANDIPIITAPVLSGSFVNGTASSFDRTSGADLQVGDCVSYQGRSVKVTNVVGPTVTIDPPISAAPPPPPAGFFDLGQRTGIYYNDIVGMPFPVLFFYGLPFPTPWMAFKVLVVPGLLAMPQIGDLILYGSKTAIVVGVNPGIGLPPFVEVGVIPFGLLPIPPLPAGLFQLIARPLAAFTPSVGVYFNLDSPAYGAPTSSAYDKFEVLGNGGSGAPVDPNIAIGNYLGVNGQFVQIMNVENGTDIAGGSDVLKARVTVSPSWSTDVQVKFPAPIPGSPVNQAGVIGGYGLPTGPYVALPASLAGMFLTTPSLAPTGSYTRLTRTVTITTDNNILQWQEDGAHQERAGTVDGTDARTAVDQVFVQGNYPGGLSGLLDKIRGPRSTTPAKVFVKTNGTLVQIGQKLKAVNKTAEKGTGTTISLTKLRELRDSLCGSWANVKAMNVMLQEQGFVVARFESKEVLTTPAACPPGQPDVRETQLVCVGLATTQVKVKAGEQVRVFWAEGRRAVPGTQKKLLGVGLTKAEVDAAVQLELAERLLSVVELTTTESSDLEDFASLGPDADLDDVLDDTRIGTINTGPITRVQIGDILRNRGRAGIIKRPPATDPSSTTQEGYQPIEDFSLPVHHLAALALQLQASFEVCDFDAAINSLPEGPLRTKLAALFAVVESALNHLVQVGKAVNTFLDESDFAKALDAITGLISAINADPTLGCLIGPINSRSIPTLPNIPQIDALLQGLSFPFQVRFDLSQLLGQAVAAVLCSVINALVQVIGTYGGEAAATYTQRAIGCLPPIEDIPGLEFPSLDVQLAIECNLAQLNLLNDIIQELISEANEVVDFINSIGSGGFVTRSVEARNNMCSSGSDLQSLIGGITSLAGLPTAQVGG